MGGKKRRVLRGDGSLRFREIYFHVRFIFGFPVILVLILSREKRHAKTANAAHNVFSQHHLVYILSTHHPVLPECAVLLVHVNTYMPRGKDAYKIADRRRVITDLHRNIFSACAEM